MEELDAFAPAVPAGQTSFMTTRELADALDVDISTVNKTVNRLLGSTSQKFGEVKTITKGGRPTKIFDAEQATAIKNEIASHHNTRSDRAKELQTQIDDAETIKRAMDILAKYSQRWKAERDALKAENERILPKALSFDRLTSFTDRKGDADKAVSLTEAARILGILRGDFIALIVKKRIVERRTLPSRGYYYKPARKYSALFIRKPHTQDSKNSSQLLVTEAGIEFFEELVRGKRDGK